MHKIAMALFAVLLCCGVATGAGEKVSEMEAMTTPADDDLLMIVDSSAEASKKIAWSDAKAAVITILDEDDMASDSATAVPSQQSVKAYVDTIAVHDEVTLSSDADAFLSLVSQLIGLDTQTANTVFAGPATGAAAVPTFRSLVAADIPTVNQDTTGSAGSLKSPATTGVVTVTGPATGTTRAKTVRDADDTLLELGGNYTPTGTWNWASASATWPTFNQSTTGNAATATSALTAGSATTATTAGSATTATTAENLKSPDTTGVVTITGPGTGTTRAKTVRDANDTVLELGGSYTPTGTWTNLTLVTPSLGAASAASLGVGVAATTAGTIAVHDAGTVTFHDDGNDTNVVVGPVADGTTTLGITGSLNLSGGVTLGTALAIASGGTGATTAQAAIDALTAVSAATNEHVLTKDTATGNAIWKAAAGGGLFNSVTGIGTAADATLQKADPKFIFQNTDEEDTSAGRQSVVEFKGEQSGGEGSTLATITASHSGTSDDEKGQIVFTINDGNDGSTPSVVALALSPEGRAYFGGSTTGAYLTGSGNSIYAGAGAMLSGVAAASGGVTLYPRNNDFDTGIGSEEADNVRVEAGGLDVVHFYESDNIASTQFFSGDVTHGGYIRRVYAASSGTLTGATDKIELNIPSGWDVIKCQLHVKVAVSDDGGDNTWTAKLDSASTDETITGTFAAAKNTNVDHRSALITDAETDILLTPNGGNFDAGEIEAHCLAEGFDAWTND